MTSLEHCVLSLEHCVLAILLPCVLIAIIQKMPRGFCIYLITFLQNKRYSQIQLFLQKSKQD